VVGEEKENAEKMLSIKSNKKLLQNHIKNAVGKNVVLKDLHNLNAKNKPKRGNDFVQILKEMKEYPSIVSVCTIMQLCIIANKNQFIDNGIFKNLSVGEGGGHLQNGTILYRVWRNDRWFVGNKKFGVVSHLIMYSPPENICIFLPL
jgi:NADH:ubiquinone oxidoreductase subunit C